MSRFFRGDYSTSDSDEDYSSDSSSDASEINFTVKKKTATTNLEKNASNQGKKPVPVDVDSDDSMFDQDSSSSESDSDQEFKGLVGRNKWLKKSVLEERGLVARVDTSKTESKRKLKIQKQTQAKKDQKSQNEDQENNGEEVPIAPVKVVSMKTIALKEQSVYKQLEAIMEARGKKNTDKQAQVSSLRTLYTDVATTSYQKVRVLLALLPAQFDVASSSAFIAGNLWKDMASDLQDLLEIIEKNRNIVITDTVPTVTEPEDDQANEAKLHQGNTVSLLGNIGSFVDRLDSEFTKSLQIIDPHSPDYLDRLNTETDLYKLILRAQHYFEQIESKDALALIIMCRIEHMYYKNISLIKSLHDQVKESYPALETLLMSHDPVDHLCKLLYKVPHERLRTRALLCHVYHHALHDRYETARDLLLMSHIQESIQNADIETQVLYNRAMAQLGLAAFRNGLINECAEAYHEFFTSGKIKELLAQGVSSGSRLSEKTPEQEKKEKARQLPFHMHINLELLECVYLTCCMLIEIPLMALHKHDYRKKVSSKLFKRLMDYHERQVFVGPAENLRECVLAASKAMIESDWKTACDLILSIKVWEVLNSSVQVKEMLTSKIKQETLATFVYSSIHCYKSFDLSFLAESFELADSTVKKTLASMIANQSIIAKFDDAFLVTLVKPKSKMSSLMLNYIEKVGILVENNEKMAEFRGFADDKKRIKKNLVKN